MRNRCPTCHLEFEEAGFCPFDGTPLAARAPSEPHQVRARSASEEPNEALTEALEISRGSSEAAAPVLHPATHQGVAPTRSSSTARRIDEPAFTPGEQPLPFRHVAPRRRRTRLLLFAMIGAGAAGAAGLVIRSRHAVVTEASRDANLVARTGDAMTKHAPIDAAPAGAAVDDADLLVGPALDAGRDAGQIARPSVPPDARVPGTSTIPSASAIPGASNPRGTIQVQIITQPEGADLYDDEQHYRGIGGGRVEEPFGARRTFTCKQSGYKPGTIKVSFNGGSAAVICALKRIKICINGIKNPFDDCEIDPAQAPAQAPTRTPPTSHDADPVMTPSAPSGPPSPPAPP